MIVQRWTVTLAATGEIVHPCFITKGDELVHPRDDADFPDWDEATMTAAPVAAAPDPRSQAFDGTNWEADPAKIRAQRWEAAKAIFEARSTGGFMLPGIGTVQTDGDSREAIRLLADEAKDRLAAGEEWSTSFKNEENVRVPLTAEQIIGVYAALRAFLGACFAVKEAIGDTLADATTVEEITAIDITAGYPPSA